jgi:uncharacterized protein (TIGR02145 family)
MYRTRCLNTTNRYTITILSLILVEVPIAVFTANRNYLISSTPQIDAGPPSPVIICVSGSPKNVWLDRNLGATRVASSTDTDVEKQASYGTYYKLDEAVCPAGFILPSEKDFKVLIAEIGEGGDMTQKALSSVMALPAAGHANDDRTRGSSIYLRGAGNQVVSISSENSNGDFYKDKAEDGDGIPIRCIQASQNLQEQ